MIRKIFIFVFIFILIVPLGLYAKEKKGAQLLVLNKDGGSVQGELIAVKESALLLLSSEGMDLTIDINHVDEIRIVKKSQMILGAGIGTVVGALGGSLLLNDIWYLEHGDLSKGEAALKSGVVFGAVGLTLGGVIGAYAGQDKVYPVAEYQQTEMQVLLAKLSKQARVTNYQ